MHICLHVSWIPCLLFWAFIVSIIFLNASIFNCFYFIFTIIYFLPERLFLIYFLCSLIQLFHFIFDFFTTCYYFRKIQVGGFWFLLSHCPLDLYWGSLEFWGCILLSEFCHFLILILVCFSIDGWKCLWERGLSLVLRFPWENSIPQRCLLGVSCSWSSVCPKILPSQFNRNDIFLSI